MKKLVFAVCALAGLYLLPGVAAWLLSGSGREFLLAKLSATAKVRISARTVYFDFPAYLRLHPSLAMEDVTVGNPAGFRSTHLLKAAKLRAEVKLLSLFGKEPHITGIDMVQPEITIEENAKGLTNAEVFLKRLSGPAGAAPVSATSGAAVGGVEIDRVTITRGEIALVGIPVAPEGPVVRQIDITINDIHAGKPYQVEASAKLYKGERSTFAFKGAIGPQADAALPLSGTATIQVSVADIPAEVRKREVGEFLSVPGDKSLVRVVTQLKGDLFATLAGSAELTIADLFFGHDDKHKLAWNSKTPAAFKVQHALGNPDWMLDIREGSAKAGTSGEWKGAFQIHSNKGVMRGTSTGSIRGVDSNEFLSVFSSVNEKISGVLAIPSYQMQFAGKGSAALKTSLTATGKMEITKGHLAAMNILSSIENALSGRPLKGGATEFTTLEANLRIAEQALAIYDIVIEGPELHVTGAGMVSAEQRLDFKLDATVSGAIGALIPLRSASSGGQGVSIPVTVTGTVLQPNVKPNVKKLAGDTAKKAIGGLLDRLINGKQ